MNAAYLQHVSAAEAGIRATGERLTQPRTAVLACLLAGERAASHLDIAHTLSEHHAVDRVTVYRVLEWLVKKGLAHRLAGNDRVWRFMINAPRSRASTSVSPKSGAKSGAKSGPKSAAVTMPSAHGHHAHFTCEACGQTICLAKAAPKVAVKLPKGFRSFEIDLLVRGRCARCA